MFLLRPAGVPGKGERILLSPFLHTMHKLVSHLPVHCFFQNGIGLKAQAFIGQVFHSLDRFSFPFLNKLRMNICRVLEQSPIPNMFICHIDISIQYLSHRLGGLLSPYKNPCRLVLFDPAFLSLKKVPYSRISRESTAYIILKEHIPYSYLETLIILDFVFNLNIDQSLHIHMDTS